MSGWLLAIALRFLPDKILGISMAAILAALPQIKEAFTAVNAVYKTLKASGVDEKTAAKMAFNIVAKNSRDVNTLEPDEIANRGLQSGH